MIDLITEFQKHARARPDRPALVIGDQEISYSRLDQVSDQIAHQIKAQSSGKNLPVAVLTDRGLLGFAAFLGCQKAGAIYVPISPQDPMENLQDKLAKLTPVLVITDQNRPGITDQNSYPILTGEDCLKPSDQVFPYLPSDATDLAYLMFTSGSTGQPKAVPVSRNNLASYIEGFLGAYPLNADDRCSQLFDLTFDLSIHEMAITWAAGACLYVPDGGRILLAAEMVRKFEITVWFSVPSVIPLMKRFKSLTAEYLSSLRLALFCGEALPASLAALFKKAAPQARMVNLYGPTEATIAITYHPIEETDAQENITPIGRPFPRQATWILDPEGKPCPEGEIGELCLSGSQVTQGYLFDDEESRRNYVTASELSGETLYRTGDLVRMDEQGQLHFLGRMDEQIKLHGHRIELATIDGALTAASGHPALTLPWPIDDHGSPTGLIAYLEGESEDTASLAAQLDQKLPAIMVPRKLFHLPQLPRNKNGKLDRKALLAQHIARLNTDDKNRRDNDG